MKTDDKKILCDTELEAVSGGSDYKTFTVGDWVTKNASAERTPDVRAFVWYVTGMRDTHFSALEYQLRKERSSDETWVYVKAEQEYVTSMFIRTDKPAWVK